MILKHLTFIKKIKIVKKEEKGGGKRKKKKTGPSIKKYLNILFFLKFQNYDLLVLFNLSGRVVN